MANGRRILGVDPGSITTGYGVVEDRGDQLICLESGPIHLGERPLEQRLALLHARLNTLIQKHQPTAMVVEAIFHAKNAQSALKLGHARGVVLLCAAQNEVPFFEYSTREVKKGLTGSGAADKQQVQQMVKILLGPLSASRIHQNLDTTDALALAIYHCNLNTRLLKVKPLSL